MKMIQAYLSLAVFFFGAANTSWAMGARPASQARDTAQVKEQAQAAAAQVPAARTDSTKTGSARLPRLVDLGAGKCIPCKMMAPILEDLKKEYAGKMEVVFIDVWQNPDQGGKYKVRVIPTQIFYDPEGKELFRHEGFYAKEDILAKWKELGHEFKK